MPQHPPLYYEAMAGVLRVERWLLPGDDLPPLDREIGLLRLANVLLLVPLPLLAWAIVRRLGRRRPGRRGRGRCCPCASRSSPTSARRSTTTTCSPCSARRLAVLLAGVARGRRSRATDVGVGVRAWAWRC